MSPLGERIDPSTFTFPRIKKARLPKVTPAVYNALAKTATFVIGGGVAWALYPPLAPPLFTIAATIAVARLVIKIGEVYHLEPMETALIYLAQFRSKHKYIQVAAVVAIVIVAVFSWKIACALAIPFGVYAAAVVGLDYYVGAQAVGRRQHETGTLPSGGAVYLS